MKKVALVLLGLAMSFMTFAQETMVVTPLKKGGFMSGRTIYLSGSWDCALPPTNWGYSVEGGIWGKDKVTSFGVDVDFMKTIPTNKKADTLIEKSIWFGPKGYLTIWQNSHQQYYVYLNPKIDTKLSHTLLEVGINPCYVMNKHMLASISLYDQIWDDHSVSGNNFTQSIWHPSISIGIVIIK